MKESYLMRASYTLSLTVSKNCTKNSTECSLAQHRFPVRFVFFVFGQFCVSSCACDFVGYKQDCRLLFASHIGHNVIRKEEKKAQNVE